MGIYIKGMEMPQEGTFNIVHIYSDGRVSLPYWGKGMQVVEGIEAIPVPPHGRLIDADALMQQIEHDTPLSDVFEKTVRRYLHDAPTIIPAEEGE